MVISTNEETYLEHIAGLQHEEERLQQQEKQQEEVKLQNKNCQYGDCEGSEPRLDVLLGNPKTGA